MKAIVTGASRGIGRAIAKQLSKEGYELVLIARKLDSLQTLKEELSKQTSVDLIALDISDKRLEKGLEIEADKFKGSNVLINNVGAYSTQKANDLDLSLLQRQLDTNLFGSILLTQYLLNELGELNKGNIINIGSKMSLQAEETATDYGISKHALKAWNDGLQASLRKKGIKVSSIYPGAVNTSSWDGIDVDKHQMVQAEDIAMAVSSILKMSENCLIEEIRIGPLNLSI